MLDITIKPIYPIKILGIKSMMLSDTPQQLLDHRAERLALTGYRCSMAGYEHGDPQCWDDLWTAYVQDGGLAFACASMGSLHYFVRSLRARLGQGLSYYPQSCRRLCRQECLVMTLLSAVQHDDADVVEYSLQQLTGAPSSAPDSSVVCAARQFVDHLSQSQLHLLPVPLGVIQSIVEKSPCQSACPFLRH